MQKATDAVAESREINNLIGLVVQLLSALMKGNSSAEYVFKIGALWIHS